MIRLKQVIPKRRVNPKVLRNKIAAWGIVMLLSTAINLTENLLRIFAFPLVVAVFMAMSLTRVGLLSLVIWCAGFNVRVLTVQEMYWEFAGRLPRKRGVCILSGGILPLSRYFRAKTGKCLCSGW
jgi:hypothetical protein